MKKKEAASVTFECVYTIECPCGNVFKEDGMLNGDPPDDVECGACGAILDLSTALSEYA